MNSLNYKKNSYINKNKIILFAFYIFILSSILTPADNLSFKIVSFIFLFTINFLYLILNIKRKKFKIINFHIFFLYPLIMLVSIVRGGNILTTISSTYFILYSSVNIIILRYNINFEKIFILSLKIMTIIIFGSYI